VEDADAAELAARTGLHPRWVAEWLRQQGAAGLLEHRGAERFALSPEGRMVLADDASPACGAGFFSHLPETMGVLTRLPEAFRTGIGLPYDAFGPEGAAGIERGLAPWTRAFLVPMVLTQVPGLAERLAAGGRVADVGCGAGVAVLEIAKAFPAATCEGWDVSQHALERAEANRAAAGTANARFHDARRAPLPATHDRDLVLTLDCLHDMTDPAGMAQAIRGALRDDGAWVVAEIKAREDYAANLAKNPMAALMYGTSVMTCLSSAMSEPGGAGLGTLGLHAAALERLVRDAGFTRFAKLAVDHPVNAFYLVQP
jgi:2-polyprenyl-3-methyl-5-hydroxy-6-metoxy-1,4-benzoquinol methylase